MQRPFSASMRSWRRTPGSKPPASKELWGEYPRHHECATVEPNGWSSLEGRRDPRDEYRRASAGIQLEEISLDRVTEPALGRTGGALHVLSFADWQMWIGGSVGTY